MNLRVPDALMVDNSEKYVVSIRLSPDGLAFSGYIPSEKDSFFYEEIKTDQAKNHVQAIKDVFFAHPFFAYSYKQIYVVCANRQYTIVPDNVFVEKQKEQLMSFVFSSPDGKTLYERLDEFDSVLLFGIQPEVYEFFSRSLLRPVFTHAVTPMLIQWKKHNLTGFPKQLYVALHDDIIDVACFDKGTLLFINSFHFDDPDDILYYILYVWKQTGLDQQKDKLFLSANARMYQTLQETLQTYLLQIELIQSPWIDANMEVPPDITALFQCGS